MAPTVKDIERAGERLKGVIEPSPLVRSGYFTRMLGSEIFLKLENLQETGAFKVRGAWSDGRSMSLTHPGRSAPFLGLLPVKRPIFSLSFMTDWTCRTRSGYPEWS